MKKVGLALGGGAARGVAHFGVLEVLSEERIPIDFVCGCSAGAIAGALYCTGSDVVLAGKLCETIDMASFLDFTIPRMGFMKGEKAEKMVEMLTKGKRIEECGTPFSCVACDLISGQTVTFTSGPIARACHASFAIPGVFEPVEIDGKQLVDGGITTRVPVEQVRAMGADYVIAVDVGYQGTGHPKAENMMNVFLNAFDLCDWLNNERLVARSDCLICPDMENIPMDSLEKASESLENGRIAARAAVEKIKRDIGMTKNGNDCAV